MVGFSHRVHPQITPQDPPQGRLLNLAFLHNEERRVKIGVREERDSVGGKKYASLFSAEHQHDKLHRPCKRTTHCGGACVLFSTGNRQERRSLGLCTRTRSSPCQKEPEETTEEKSTISKCLFFTMKKWSRIFFLFL